MSLTGNGGDGVLEPFLLVHRQRLPVVAESGEGVAVRGNFLPVLLHVAVTEVLVDVGKGDLRGVGGFGHLVLRSRLV